MVRHPKHASLYSRISSVRVDLELKKMQFCEQPKKRNFLENSQSSVPHGLKYCL